MEFKTPQEAFDYALERSFAIYFAPGWRSFDPPKDRNYVSVTILDTNGETHWEGRIPIIS
jgi:hypothetical protein